jgi:hypothetical protein
MISPYRSEIRLGILNVNLAIKTEDYDYACESLDKLSIPFMQEVAFYSRCFLESRDYLNSNKRMSKEEKKKIKKDLKGLGKKLTSVNQEWKDAIRLKELCDRED